MKKLKSIQINSQSLWILIAYVKVNKDLDFVNLKKFNDLWLISPSAKINFDDYVSETVA